MNHFHLSIFLLVSATFAVRSTAAPSTGSGEVPRPNFIVILTDDQGWGTTSVVYDPKVPDSKSDFHRTPNIERLAAAGMRFTQGYSAHPNCSPSRAALLTGRSPAALHFTDICNRNDGGLYVGNRLLPPQHINALPEEEQTIPELLKATHPEYTAAHFGKWHLKGGGPEAHGFDAGDGSTGNAEGGKKDNLPNDPKRCYSITERAIDWMKEQSAVEKPFYLQVSHYATHLPLQARPETLSRFESATSGTRHDNVPFAAMIADMDESIGQLLDALAASGVADNTYVIFTADNGTFPVESPGNINGPLRGSKATIWEAGVRVPFIVTGPGIESNSVSRQPAIGYDILPTICELAGIETWPETVEGGSLIPALYQKGDISRSRDALYFHWPHYQHAKKSKPDSTIITGDYKLHYWWETGDIQLFNLSKDLAETTDLAKSHPEKAASLKKKLFSYLEDIDAQLPVANYDYDPATDPARLKGTNRKKKKTNTSTTVKMNPIYEEVHPAPDIAGGSLQIVVEATQRNAVADGVLLAHGGNVAGYSLHVEQGIPVFEVTRKKEIFRIAWPQPVKGKMRIVADLGDNEMSLSVNGAPKVSATSPGLFRAQPKIGLSVGYDARSNAGSYEVPNPYNGTILSTRIDAGGTPPAVAKVMPRSEIEAGLASHDKALFIKEGWIRDPYIILGPDDYYYLTGTTPNPGDSREQSDPYNTGLGDESIVGWQARIWRSKDLIDWESLGTPFSLKEGIWYEKRPKRFEEVPEELWFLWAPEVHWLGDRWALTHTSPSPVRGANLALTEGADLKGSWTHPMGAKIGHRHDPSLFKDDGTWYLLYGNTQVVPLNADFSLTTAEPVQIDPSDSRTTPAGETLSVIGHEGATMRKIGDKYVHIGTAWSTDTGRKGSYNLYYCTADKITGPYGERKFIGRFLGHGTPFQDKQGRWWCTAFYNGNIPPVGRKGIETRDLSATAQTINQRGTTIVPLDVKVLEDGEIYIRAKDPAYANPGPDEVQKFAKFSFAAVARESPEKDPASTDSEKQPLSPETEMAIMKVMNLENRIQTLQTVPVKMTDDELAGHFSGTWICFTTMRLNGQLGRGIMEIRLEQDGDELVGEGGQLKNPFDPPATIRPIGTRQAHVSDFVGQFKKARHNMVVIERRRVDGPTWATFTAVMAGDGRTARGTLVNAGGNYGLMFMVRREFLSDFEHLLTEEGRQAEAARRLIGIEKLEATLDTASMDTARIEWWKTDRNKDGKLQYSEFPHPDWKRANRNNDDAVDWAEEVSDRVLRKLAQEGAFLAKHGNDAQKQWPSIYAWGVAHPGFEQIFHFVDWDRDGKITLAEYTAFENQLNAYNDPSFPTTNQKGQTREDLRLKKGSGKKSKGVTKTKPNADPHIVQMEAAFSEKKLAKAREMWAALDKNRDNVWQYDEFPHPDWKRANRNGDDGLSWKEELADQMFRSQSRTYPKKYGSTSQKEWPTQEAWNKDRPDFEQLFAFIDWDHDGVITAAEYKVFDVQIKSYTDGSYPKTNEHGESGMEVFKRLAAQPPKAGQAPKAGQSRKTSWNSQEEWDRDKPTVKWIFPFIDKNNDGKIDSDEYEAIQQYKKEHADWQDRARKELGLTTPEDQ